MHFFQSGRHRIQDILAEILRVVPLVPVDQLCDRATVHQIEQCVDNDIIVVHLVAIEYVGVLEACKDSELIQNLLLLLMLPRFDHLESEFSLVVFLHHFIDVCLTTFAKFLFKLVRVARIARLDLDALVEDLLDFCLGS